MWKRVAKDQSFGSLKQMGELNKKSPFLWTTKDVSKWITLLGFPQYSNLFVKHGITGELIFSLDIIELKAIGVSVLGHRKKILKEISSLGSSIKNSQSNSQHSLSQQSNSQLSEDTHSESSESSVNNIIKAKFIVNGDETQVTLKKTYTFKKVQMKVRTNIGVSDVKFLHNGSLIETEKDWQQLAQSSNSFTINLERKNPNQLSKVEKKVFDTLSDATIIIDKKGIILFTNRKVTKELGYQKNELIGKNVKVLMPEEYASKHDGYLSNYLKTGEKKVIGKGRSVKIKLSNGVIREAWLSVTENKTQTGRHTFTGTLHLVEQQGRSNDMKSYKILDCINQSIVVIDDSGLVQFMNRSAEKLLSYKTEELLGQNISTIMPEPYSSRHDGYIRNYLKSGKSKIIGTKGRLVAAKSGNGSLIPINLEISELVLKNKRYFVGVMNRQKKVEKAKTVLEASRDVINSLLVPAIIIDQEGIIQALNEDATNLLGYELVDVVGENVSVLMNDTDAKKHDSYLQRYLKTGEKHVINMKRKVVAKSKDGKLKPVTLSVTEKVDKNGDKIFLGILIPKTKK